MRALSYVIAVVLVLTGPSLAGPAAADLPDIGTFSYSGSPLPNPAPEVAATRPVNHPAGPMADGSAPIH
jgi:hypothetical protein